MKVSVKTLKGNHFHIQVQPTDKVLTVKKQIEEVQGAQIYPCEQQLLICKGKVLKDETTIEENEVAEKTSLVVMLSKTRAFTAGTPLTQQAPPPFSPASGSSLPSPSPATSTPPGTGTIQTDANTSNQAASISPASATAAAQDWPSAVPLNLFPHRLTNLAAEASSAATAQAPNIAQTDNLSQGLPSMQTGAMVCTNGALVMEVVDFLRNCPQFEAVRPMVEANPQILEPMLQRLSKKYPRVMGIIQDHKADILHLVSKPVKGAEGDVMNLGPEEREVIERLEAKGYAQDRVIQAFLTCDKNEESAAKYLEEHGDNDDNNNEK